MNNIVQASIGGALIGLSAFLVYIFLGRIAGISGIFASLLESPSKQIYWKYSFLLGLLVGALLMFFGFPEYFSSYSIKASYLKLVTAGLLVGFGTRLGSGCTSGHGVCGISRGSSRSIIATITFIVTAIVVNFLAGQVS